MSVKKAPASLLTVHDFYPLVLQEIDDLSNPAFGSDDCIMIVREPNTDRVLVLMVVRFAAVNCIVEVGYFVLHELAVAVANINNQWHEIVTKSAKDAVDEYEQTEER